MQDKPPILVIADMPNSFSFKNVELAEDAAAYMAVNVHKNGKIEEIEIVADGMSFLLSEYSPAEIQNAVTAAHLENYFAEAVPSTFSAIGISPSEHVADGVHVPTVNKALLKVAKLIGQSIAATNIIWRPAALNVGFEFFSETIDQYLAGGPFPVLAQVAMVENKNSFETRGLYYFAGQEVKMTVPADYPVNETLKRLVRITNDIAINGKIDVPIEIEGLTPQETFFFDPQRYLILVTLKLEETDASQPA